MKRVVFLAAFAASSLAAQPVVRPQAPLPSPTPDQPITLDVTRVNMLFTVSDRKGRFVNNLNKDDFEIFESKKKQNVLEFVAETDLPLRIGILIDTSNSIRDRFRFELEAAGEFLNTLVRKGHDRALVISYDTDVQLVADLTDDTELLASKLRELRPGGGTALYDAIFYACKEKLALDKPLHKYRRAVVIISDGDDNSSKYSRDQALELAHKADVVMYAISTNISKAETDGDKVLKYFARETGGLAFFPFKVQDMEQDFENIANELRSQYSLLYRPEPLKTDGLYHEVNVHVKGRKDLVVRARKGYYAPRM
jgi:Ca-activated chloride channel homolog